MENFSYFLSERSKLNSDFFALEFYKDKNTGKTMVDMDMNGKYKTFPLSMLWTNLPLFRNIEQVIYSAFKKSNIIEPYYNFTNERDARVELIKCIQKYFIKNKDPFDIVVKSTHAAVNKE